MPPDSVKDSIGKPGGVPVIYILPTIKFDIQGGVSLAEFEFPTYFNYFVLKTKITIVTDQKGGENLKKVFQETLFGPVNLEVRTKA